MIPYNPGNLLPFYTEGYSSNDRRWQRHRQHGTDIFPYGLPCPRTRLLPFQVYFTGAQTDILAWTLVNPEDDTEQIVLDESTLEVSVMGDSSGFWVTWKAEEDLDVIPDCGFWYIFLNVDGKPQLVSEVLECRDLCGFEKIGLEIETDSCNVDGGNISFGLDPIVETGSGTTYVIQRKNGLSWHTIATNNEVTVVELLSAETREYRIQATTPCGLIITQPYIATWDSADGCGTLALSVQAVSINEAGILSTPAVWRWNFTNEKDKANVLYQTGYKQFLYMPHVVWDVPAIDREVETIVNGLGETTNQFTRTVERRGFETPDLPDYVLGFLAKAGDLDTILFEDAKLEFSLSPVNFEVENLTFESRQQGNTLNVGRFYFDVEAETWQGCQEDFVLAD